MKRFLAGLAGAAACLMTSVSMAEPASAQQWGLLYPDGSIRGRNGILLEGPNPGRILDLGLTLPINTRSIDRHSGTIYRGGLIESGPNPGRVLSLCLQTGIC